MLRRAIKKFWKEIPNKDMLGNVNVRDFIETVATEINNSVNGSGYSTDFDSPKPVPTVWRNYLIKIILAFSSKKNKNNEHISYKSTEQSETPPIFPTTQSDVSTESSNWTDNSTDTEEWKPGTTLKVGDSMIVGLKEVNCQEIERWKFVFSKAQSWMI